MLGSINKVFADCSTQALYLILGNNCAFLLVGGFLHDPVVGKTGKESQLRTKKNKKNPFSFLQQLNRSPSLHIIPPVIHSFAARTFSESVALKPCL